MKVWAKLFLVRTCFSDLTKTSSSYLLDTTSKSQKILRWNKKHFSSFLKEIKRNEVNKKIFVRKIRVRLYQDLFNQNCGILTEKRILSEI